MKMKLEVLGSGSFEGRTRDGKIFQRMRMMGHVFDCDGSKIPCTCDMGFGGVVDRDVVSGDLVIVDVTSLDTKNAMLALVFSSLSHVAPSARELKH